MNGRLFGVDYARVWRPDVAEEPRLHSDVTDALAVVHKAQRRIVPQLGEEHVDLKVR